jgi:hypothetical protein
VVGFSGLARSGKSTVAVGLSRRGYDLWANDALVLEVARTSIQALPVPFSVRLRPDSEALLGRHGEQQQWIEPNRQGSMPLSALCVLHQARGNDSGDIKVQRLSPAPAFRALLTHACCFMTEEAGRKRRTMAQYLEVVKRVPVLAISFASGLQHLPAVLDAVEEILGASKPRPVMVGLNSGFSARPAESVTMTIV